jgi:hypothetical protein
MAVLSGVMVVDTTPLYQRGAAFLASGIHFPEMPGLDPVQIPPGGSLTGDYMSGSPSQSLRYRLVLVYAPTAELLHATEDVLNGTGSVRTYMQPELASLPAYAGVVVSAPFDLIDNGDRFPAKPLPA